MNNTAKLAEIDKLYAQIPTFQCVEGCTDCCGPILTSRLEYGRMLSAAGRTEKDVNIEALSNIKNGSMACPFIKDGHHCGIYEVRPLICRLFGAVDQEHLVCPHGKAPLVKLTAEQSAQLLKRVTELGQ